jgi:hypothetical protein
MTKSHPSRTKPKAKKKSSASNRSGKAPRKRRSPAKKKTVDDRGSSVPLGRLERTRRLLLAALRVWELKRRVRE